ncbi:Sulfotransferase [Pedobacter sp. BAL39]|nr:Sulfotransferase [Pedobacter sp. BAL39]
MRLFFTALTKEEPDINEMETDGIISSRLIMDQSLGMPSSAIPEEDLLEIRSAMYHRWAQTSKKEFLLCKVHDACFREGIMLFPGQITRGVIYVIRNPFDIAASLANHNRSTIAEAVKALCDNQYTLSNSRNKLTYQLSQYMGTWSNHVDSWTNAHRDNIQVIKYEEMISKPFDTFSKVIDYLGLSHSSEDILSAIDKTSFDKIKKQESEKGFGEAPLKVDSFFRSGKVGGWQQELSAEEVRMIIDVNYATLVRYGYISEKGEVLV